MSATMSPAPADVDRYIEHSKGQSDETLLEALVVSIEHLGYLGLEAGDGAVYNTVAVARVALCELALRGVTLSEDMLGEALKRMHADDEGGPS